MQANRASDEMREKLAQWLQSPAAASKSATEDLAWLNNQKDLSAVSIDPEKKSQSQVEVKHSIKSSSSFAPKAATTGEGGGGGGLLALFRCAGKRK